MTARRPQRGFTLVAAVFIVVVLALAAAFMVRTAGVQQATVLFALQGARAYHAARSGLEWGIAQVAMQTDSPAGLPATTVISFTDPGLQGFRATVTIAQCTLRQEGDLRMPVLRIFSTGEFAGYGSVDYVSRRLEVNVTGAQTP
ncbi:MAG: pilus assembly protein MshP [Pseudomonadota bacterium]|nr:pilus assembly protein MshP [Pseudomonadota bacterium]